MITPYIYCGKDRSDWNETKSINIALEREGSDMCFAGCVALGGDVIVAYVKHEADGRAIAEAMTSQAELASDCGAT